jgi:hypothetical protein
MGGFDTKLVLYIPNKSQTSNGDGFRPSIVAHRQTILQTLLDPLAVCRLKIVRSANPLNSLKICKPIMA